MDSGLHLRTLYRNFRVALMDAFNFMNSGTSEIGHIERGAVGVSRVW